MAEVNIKRFLSKFINIITYDEIEDITYTFGCVR